MSLTMDINYSKTMMKITKLLHDSYIDNQDHNNGHAYAKFKKALPLLESVKEDERNQVVITYFKHLFMNNDKNFIEKTLTEVIGRFKDYDKLLMPYSLALKYLQKKDGWFLSNLHPEVSGVVRDILGMEE